MQDWSKQRLTATLVVAALVAMEAVSFITAPVPPCLVDPAGYAAVDAAARRVGCPTLHGFLLAHARAFYDLLHDPQRATAFFAVVFAAATFLWWLSLRTIARASLATAEAAKNSAEALMAAEQAQLVTVPDAGNIPQMLSELGRSDRPEGLRPAGSERMFVKLVCKNYGRSTAILKEISHDFQHWQDLPYRPTYVASRSLPRERVVAAGASTEPIECLLGSPLSAAAATSVRAGDSALWLYGRLVYEDAFGRTREHRFLHRYRIGYGFQPYEHPEFSKNT